MRGIVGLVNVVHGWAIVVVVVVVKGTGEERVLGRGCWNGWAWRGFVREGLLMARHGPLSDSHEVVDNIRATTERVQAGVSSVVKDNGLCVSPSECNVMGRSGAG